MDKLILKDGTEISILAGAALSEVKVRSENKVGMLAIWEKMTKDNLSEVLIKNDAGLTVGAYVDLVLEKETSEEQEDGAIITTFCFREKTSVEKRLEALEESQQIQDEAIVDLGVTTSKLAGEGGTE